LPFSYALLDAQPHPIDHRVFHRELLSAYP